MSNIKQIRVGLGLKQSDVATILGVTKSMVSNYEAGRPEIPPEAARKFITAAASLGSDITFDDIYGATPAPIEASAAAACYRQAAQHSERREYRRRRADLVLAIRGAEQLTLPIDPEAA